MIYRLLCLVTLLPLVVFAEPVVLGKEVNTVNASKYRSNIEFRLQQGKELDQGLKPEDRNFSTYKFSLEGLLPIVSEKLSPGFVEKREGIKNAGLKPLCLVGADNQSLQWIAAYKNELLKIGAMCLIVQAETVDDLDTLKKALYPIPWQPGSGDFVADHHQIKHYPVLISRRAIEQ